MSFVVALLLLLLLDGGLQELLLDDVLDGASAYDSDEGPKQIEIREGSFIMILPGGKP